MYFFGYIFTRDLDRDQTLSIQKQSNYEQLMDHSFCNTSIDVFQSYVYSINIFEGIKKQVIIYTTENFRQN